VTKTTGPHQGTGSEGSTTVVAPLADRTSTKQVRVFSLRVTSAADHGAELTVSGADAGPVYVGTSPACQLRLSDVKVSRRHIALQVDDTLLRLTDLESTNGTMVSGMLVREVFLRGGEVVLVGDTELSVTEREPTNASRTLAMSFGRVLGVSMEMRRLYPLCERLASSDVSILIEGEGGTGKELLAEALHRASARSEGPFVVFDGTAIPPKEVEAALFGAESGALEQATGGTLYLNEVADLDSTVQAKLLRFLEHGGGDVRLIASTRRDIDKEIQARRFRDDLFFRLAVGRIELPPLRKRAGDVRYLIRHFWKQLGGGQSLPPTSLMERFDSYSWPGNVRELRNAVLRRIALGDIAQQKELEMTELGDQHELDAMDRVVALRLPLAQSRDLVVEEFERRYLAKLLEHHAGNATDAAKAAGVARRYFQLLRTRRGT
jgi:DNA-binding NtrC family response regulator